MTEILFILTTIFIAYVVYTIIGEQRASAKNRTPVEKPETLPTKAETHPPAVAEAQQAVAVTQEKPAAAKPAAPKTTSSRSAAKQTTPKTAAKTASPAKPAKQAPAPKTAVAATPAQAKPAGIKDPKTGEVVTAYTNYRFTKRWIKEALVAEGLVDKIYSTKELNPEIETKIKDAIAKLETMEKYHP